MPKTSSQSPEKKERNASAVSTDNTAAQNTWRNIGIISGREYKNQIGKRGYKISTVVLLAVIIIVTTIPTIIQYFNSRSNPPVQVALVNNAGTVAGMNDPALAAYMAASLNKGSAPGDHPYTVPSYSFGLLGSLENEVKDNKLAVLLELDRDGRQNLLFTYTTNATAANDTSLPRIQAVTSQLAVLDRANQLGLNESQITSLTAASLPLTIVRTQDTSPASPSNAGIILALAGAYLSLYAMTAYANSVAQGVAAEKSNRVMEILVNIASPFQLLAGKILGIAAASMAQMGALVVVGIGALLLQSPLQMRLFGSVSTSYSQYLTGVSIPFYLLFLVYFVLNFLFYSTLFAGLGAMVKKQEEVASAIAVPMMFIIASFLLVYLVVFSPDSVLGRILAYVPFFTGEMMLARIGMGVAAWWEIVVTILIMLAAIAAGTWFAARLYRHGVLMYGQKPGLGQLFMMAFALDVEEEIGVRGDAAYSQNASTQHTYAQPALAQPAPDQPSTHLYFVDHLRLALTILVVLHHLAVVYGGVAAFYYVEPPPQGDTLTIAVLLAFVLLNQAYFMGFFFLLSGYLTPASFERKGLGRFLKDRLLRLGIPLLIFWFVLSPLSALGIYQIPATLTGLTSPPTWQDYPTLIGPGPLWFVLMLLVFDGGYALWRWLRRNHIARPESLVWPPRYRTLGAFILGLALATYLIRLVIPLGTYVWAFPTLSYFPQYLSFFVIGTLVARRDGLRAIPWSMGKVGFFTAAVATLTLIPLIILGGAAGYARWGSAVYALWDSTFSVGVCLGLIALFHRYLNRSTRFSRFLSRQAFSVYIIHAPVIVALAVVLRNIHPEQLLKFGAVAVIGVPLCFGVAYLFRKIPLLSRVL